MTNSINDGLSKPDHLDDGAIQSIEIGSGAVLSANISGQQILSRHTKILGAGSPIGFGLSVQAGTVKASNAAVWAAFPVAFAGSGYNVSFGIVGSVAEATSPGCVSDYVAGSFGFLGTSGITYHWLAIGSGAL
jgi:hypothetical protein